MVLHSYLGEGGYVFAEMVCPLKTIISILFIIVLA